jgi:hypothetical protein
MLFLPPPGSTHKVFKPRAGAGIQIQELKAGALQIGLKVPVIVDDARSGFQLGRRPRQVKPQTDGLTDLEGQPFLDKKTAPAEIRHTMEINACPALFLHPKVDADPLRGPSFNRPGIGIFFVLSHGALPMALP